jgi:hypothetical protein
LIWNKLNFAALPSIIPEAFKPSGDLTMKKLFCMTALLLLTACASGSPLNQTRDTFDTMGRHNERDQALSASRCHDSVERSTGGFDSPADPDYLGLYDQCMAKSGWAEHADKPTPAMAPAVKTND